MEKAPRNSRPPNERDDDPEIDGSTLAIEERVELGSEMGSNKKGGIVPFPAAVDTVGLIACLPERLKAFIAKREATGFTLEIDFYRNAASLVIQAVLRFSPPPGEVKQIWPLVYIGSGDFRLGTIPYKRPLCGLDALAARPEAPVLVVEGERTRRIAQDLLPDYVVITWSGGAFNVHKTEMLALEGRKIFFWPDNDEAGRRAGDIFAAEALQAGAASFGIVELPAAVPEKHDLGDPLPLCIPDADAVRDLVASAKPVQLADVVHLLKRRGHHSGRRLLGHEVGHSKVESAAIGDALAEIDPDVSRMVWVSMARCLYFAKGQEGLRLFRNWSARGAKYKKGEPEALWREFEKQGLTSAPPLRWLFRLAEREMKRNEVARSLCAEAIARAVLEEMNESHAVVIRGSKTLVACEYYDPVRERWAIDFLAKEDFARRYVDHVPLPADDAQASGKKRTAQRGTWWFNSPSRRQFEGIAFAPGRTLPKSHLNLWRGFAVEPSGPPSGWKKLKHHLLHHVAGNDPEAFDYILNWLAFGVQKLDRRIGVALVLIGPKGSGKSIITKLYGFLFGSHTFITSQEEDLTGRFNSRLEDTILLGVEEAFAPQSKNADGVLKDMITRDDLRLEAKFVAPWTGRNHLRIIMTSNNDHVVRADGIERRYAVFHVETPFQQNPHERLRYFSEINAEMKNGGYEAMLSELLERDLRGWNPEAIPETPALRRQKLQTMLKDPIRAWAFERLSTGGPILIEPDHDGHGPSSPSWSDTKTVWVPAGDVLDDYNRFLRRHGYYAGARRFAAAIGSLFGEDFRSHVRRDHLTGAPQREYPFPPLPEARAKFTRATGIQFE